MGLEDFMDGFDDEATQDETQDDVGSDKQDYTYRGDKDLLNITIEDVDPILDKTELEFQSIDTVINGITRAVESPDGSYLMVVSCPREERDVDCLKVHVLESKSLYDVIEPYEIYMVEGWKEELKEAIKAVRENSDEIMFCPRCDSVMIIRTTNSSDKRIRGCSNYPDCKYSEKS